MEPPPMAKEEELPTPGKLLITRRSLNVQAKAEETEQRDNLFHTRCLVQGKVCSLIIDGGSCTNVASEEMINKLGLKTTNHPKPYKLEWLNEKGELSVKQQVVIPFSIGKYEDEIVCDVLPMGACHILLGRPWQFDRKVLHDGFTNRYSFKFNGRKTTLVPMTPQEIYQDQLILKKKEKEEDPPKVKPSSFLAKSSDIKRALSSQQPFLLFVFKEAITNLTNLTPVLPSKLKSFLQDYKDVFPKDNPRKYCKEIDLVRTEPNLFVMISAQDEKRFGFEKVKEFRVSNSVFDKMISSFEMPTPEEFSKPKGFLFHEFREFSSSLRVSLCSNTFELFGSKTDSAFDITHPELKFLLKNVLFESSEFCKLNENDHVSNRSLFMVNSFTSKAFLVLRFVQKFWCSNHVLNYEKLFEVHKKQPELVSDVLIKENMFDHLRDVFIYSSRTFDVFSLVLVKAKERQVKNSKTGIVPDLVNQIDYGPTKEENQARSHIKASKRSQRMINNFGIWNWKYLRKTTPNAQGCSILKFYLAIIFMIICLTFFVVTKLFPFDVGDLAFSQFKSTTQKQGMVVTTFSMFKDEPPDATYNLNSSYNIFEGKIQMLQDYGSDFVHLIADEPDLRSNPFQEEGDDKIMEDIHDLELESSEEQEVKELVAEELRHHPSGPVTRARKGRLKASVNGLLQFTYNQATKLSKDELTSTLVMIQFRSD